jgi:hypothetical protein
LIQLGVSHLATKKPILLSHPTRTPPALIIDNIHPLVTFSRGPLTRTEHIDSIARLAAASEWPPELTKTRLESAYQDGDAILTISFYSLWLRRRDGTHIEVRRDDVKTDMANE